MIRCKVNARISIDYSIIRSIVFANSGNVWSGSNLQVILQPIKQKAIAFWSGVGILRSEVLRLVGYLAPLQFRLVRVDPFDGFLGSLRKVSVNATTLRGEHACQNIHRLVGHLA